ncbi:glycosyltransferase [bacterium]|nr:glycosyltransferase [bacterium]
MSYKVNIICPTYNQENYIKYALDGFLMQKTNFKFKVFVCDDFSTDKTREIISEYVKSYPEIIVPVFREKNIGAMENFLQALELPDSEYVAFCDGDDYWTDENKLQKQVDFLDANQDYSICFHPVRLVYENIDKPDEIIGTPKGKNPQPYWDLLEENYIPSNSVMYRYECIKKELPNYPRNMYPGDWFNHTVAAKYGKIGHLPDMMAIYRRQVGGISYTASKNPLDELRLRHGIKEVNFHYAVWKLVDDVFPNYYKDKFIPILREVSFTYLKYCKLDELKQLFETYGEHFGELKYPNYAEEGRLRKRFKRYKRYFNIVLILSIVLFVICVVLGIYVFKF